MTTDEPEPGHQPEGPEFEMWNHLNQGWQQAYDDMAQQMLPGLMAFYEGLARLVVGATTELYTAPDGSRMAQLLEEAVPGVSITDRPALFRGLLHWYGLRKDPWLTHAVELELGSQGIGRACEALERFALIAPSLGEHEISDRARAYTSEVVGTFLFGFDIACIALCRATFDQIAKQVLVDHGVLTEPQSRKELLTTHSLIARLRQAGLGAPAWESAELIGNQGNTVMHKHPYDPRVLRQLAVDSLTALIRSAAVLVDGQPERGA